MPLAGGAGAAAGRGGGGRLAAGLPGAGSDRIEMPGLRSGPVAMAALMGGRCREAFYWNALLFPLVALLVGRDCGSGGVAGRCWRWAGGAGLRGAAEPSVLSSLLAWGAVNKCLNPPLAWRFSCISPLARNRWARWAMLFALIIGHALADYPLQGKFLAIRKNRHIKPLEYGADVPSAIWVYCLSAHSLVHAGAVWVVTGSALFGFIEFVLHWCDRFREMRKVDEFPQGPGAASACRSWPTWRRSTGCELVA